MWVPLASDDPSPASDMVPVALGQILLEKYRVDRIIGEGGMGYVVAATHLTLGTPVAIKLLRTEHAGRADFTARFLREARAAVAIQSEHVARVLDVGTLPGGAPYMVLELLKGVDLGEELARRRRIPYEDAVEYLLQACEALAEAHGLGLVHRDLKPSNLFLTRRADGSPMIKVLDFGIAKAIGGRFGDSAAQTRTGALLGTPYYMSPEQARGQNLDPRSDLYSVGVVLYELFTGERPFEGKDPQEVMIKHVSVDARRPSALRPDLPPLLERIILACLSKDREKRPPTANDLYGALMRVT